MSTECNQGITIPTLSIDLCKGKTTKAICVIDSNWYDRLGLEENSNQQQVNQAVYQTYLNLKATIDTLPNTGNQDLSGKEDTIPAGTVSQYYRGDKTFQALNKSAVGLPNADNTSDLNKPISTATQNALTGKADLVNGKIPITQINSDIFEGYTLLDPQQNLSFYEDSGFVNSINPTSEKIYIDLISNLQYRYDSVNGYVLIGGGGGSLNADNIVETLTRVFVSSAEKTAINHANRNILDNITEAFTTGLKNVYDGIGTSFTNLLATGSRLITTGEITKLANTNGTNSGDNAPNTNSNSYTDAALSGKEDTIPAGTVSQYYRGDKTFQALNKSAVGLPNADNTSDLNKPISTATQNALNTKQDINENVEIRNVSGSILLDLRNKTQYLTMTANSTLNFLPIGLPTTANKSTTATVYLRGAFSLTIGTPTLGVRLINGTYTGDATKWDLLTIEVSILNTATQQQNWMIQISEPETQNTY